MTAKEFWEGDPRLAAAYRKKHWLEIEAKNQELWLQGMYNFNAVSVAVSNAFRGKGKKAENYIKEPVRILPETEKEIKAKAEAERKRAVEALTLWEKRWKSNHQER